MHRQEKHFLLTKFTKFTQPILSVEKKDDCKNTCKNNFNVSGNEGWGKPHLLVSDPGLLCRRERQGGTRCIALDTTHTGKIIILEINHFSLDSGL